MHCEVEVDGRLRRVVVHRVGTGVSVEIDGRRYDARSEQGFLEPGTLVEVLRVEGPGLVVRPAKGN